MRYSNIFVALPCILMMLSPLVLGSPIPYSDDDDDHNSDLTKRSPLPVPYNDEKVPQFDKRSPHGDYDDDEGFPGLQKRSPVPMVDDDDDIANLMKRSLPDGGDEDLPVLRKRSAQLAPDDNTVQEESPGDNAFDTDVGPRRNGRVDQQNDSKDGGRKGKGFSMRGSTSGFLAGVAESAGQKLRVAEAIYDANKDARLETNEGYKEMKKQNKNNGTRKYGTASQKRRQNAKDSGKSWAMNSMTRNRNGRGSDSDGGYSGAGTQE